MNVLQAGAGSVAILRFLPDGRRLLAGNIIHAPPAPPTVRFAILPTSGGDPVPLDLPRLDLQHWHAADDGHAVAVHPDGGRCWVAWGGELYALRTTDGKRLQGVAGVPAHQVVVTPDGGRLLAATAGRGVERKCLTTIDVGSPGEAMLGQRPLPDLLRHLAGVLPDGRIVTVENEPPKPGKQRHTCWVRVRSADAGEELAAVQNRSWHATRPAISADGRYLGLIGYGSMYVHALPGLGKPRAIGGTATYGDFRSFAFHPDGRTLAVIHRGPTLVRLYDVGTLKLRAKLNWKLRALLSVAFSPDGTLGAAGSADGRVVVWDAD